MSHQFEVYYWKAKDEIILADRWGRVCFINIFGTDFFIRTTPRSKLPKTLVYLGEL